MSLLLILEDSREREQVLFEKPRVPEQNQHERMGFDCCVSSMLFKLFRLFSQRNIFINLFYIYSCRAKKLKLNYS